MRRLFHLPALIALAVVLGGCFGPSLGTEPFACGEGDACPEGYACDRARNVCTNGASRRALASSSTHTIRCS